MAKPKNTNIKPELLFHNEIIKSLANFNNQFDETIIMVLKNEEVKDFIENKLMKMEDDSDNKSVLDIISKWKKSNRK